MATVDQLEQGVIDWAEQKGIFEKSTPVDQIGKTQEELDELVEEIIWVNDKEAIKMELGDVLVTLSIQAKMQGTTLAECLELALNKITKRKGSMQNGVFVKEGD